MAARRLVHVGVTVVAALVAHAATACSTSEPCEPICPTPYDAPALTVMPSVGSGVVDSVELAFSGVSGGSNGTIVCESNLGMTVCPWVVPVAAGSYQIQIYVAGVIADTVSSVMTITPPLDSCDCTSALLMPSNFVIDVP